MPYKAIAKLIPTMQSINLVSYNAELVKKKNKKPSDFIKVGTGTIVGTELMRVNAGFISGL